MNPLLAATFTLATLCVIRMVWSMIATGMRENKASGVAALAGSIGTPWFLAGCLFTCTAVYFVARVTA